MEAVNDFLSVVIQGMIALAIPILVAAAVPWLRQKGKEIQQSLNSDQMALLHTGIEVAVRAAEQAGVTGQIKNLGAEKKKYAIQAAQAYMHRLGLSINVTEISDLLEAEVNRQFANPSPVIDTPDTRRQLLNQVVETAVLASQQGSVQNLLSDLKNGLAAGKKEQAVSFAVKLLSHEGIEIDPEIVSGLIDAQVLRLKLQSARAGK